MEEESPKILKLDDDVIQRIAAGEVIHQPLNVVKELLENAIDAGSDSITIKVQNGGYTLISVADNGCGIRESELPLACRRHTTSKLRDFSDLSKIQTFGFRGEALFSMTCCSHLSIITKTENSETGFIAHYLDGELSEPIEQIHATDGTVIEVRDLFYNNSIRLNSHPKNSVEVKKIAQMIRCYAIVYPYIAFGFSSNGKELVKTYGNSTFENVIRNLYCIEDEGAFFSVSFGIDSKVDVEAFLSHPGNARAPNTSAIFINGRLVSCKQIKRGLELVYNDVLAKGLHGFFFIVLNLPSNEVDVNIHPSKKEVRFLNEKEIVDSICKRVKEELESRSNVREVEMLNTQRRSQKYSSQQIPKGQKSILDFQEDAEINNNHNEIQDQNIENYHENTNESFIKNDNESYEHNNGNDFNITMHSPIQNDYENANISSNESPLSSMPPSPNKTEPNNEDFIEDDEAETKSEEIIPKVMYSQSPKKAKSQKSTITKSSLFSDLKYEPIKPKIPLDPHTQTIEQVLTGGAKTVIQRAFRTVQLSSVKNLREKVSLDFDEGLKRFFHDSTFTGFIGLRILLLQSGKSLYMINLYALLKDFFYQQFLNMFANLPQYRFNPPIPILETLQIITSGNENDEELVKQLETRAPLLSDYFSISIHEGKLYSLPLALNGYVPSYNALPLFLYQLSTNVNWDEEEECYIGILDALSSLYSVTSFDEKEKETLESLQHQIMTIIYPNMKKNYNPTITLSNSIIPVEFPVN
ncbi:MLH1-like protein 1 [Histomonas meleagridis]|uniref:MLH1-like protein 1 n=1 Tax=Histomonas meleagridis TaxID=135588 RepID=UPI003559BB82|nr:MLH1-like protein 1 [Histomonas meleagridis]KAH0801779.1 MLH1-like protein 1 [Histomonas meleagridis]